MPGFIVRGIANESVDNDFDIENIIPEGYEATADEKIPTNKINAQLKSTIKGLRSFIDSKSKRKV